METKDYMLPCLNKKLFGIDCPGCGLQRATVKVVKGEFKEAFYQFPPIYTTIAFLVVVVIHFLIKKKVTSKILIALAIVNTIIMIVAYFIKMNNFLNT